MNQDALGVGDSGDHHEGKTIFREIVFGTGIEINQVQPNTTSHAGQDVQQPIKGIACNQG